MHLRFILAVVTLVLVGCGNTVTPTATLPATSAPAPQPTLPPTPTSLAEGLIVRLGTPDPSPKCPEHYPWFFENRADECATTLLNTWGVLQPFEHGLLVWFQEGGRTYVLVDDGSPFKPYYEAVDTTGSPPPEPDPNLVPPPGLHQPVLGFAKFWRGMVPGYEWVRERLGWAVAPEAGYSALWQCNNAAGETARCYFTGPGDEIIAMTRGGAQHWNYWQRPVRFLTPPVSATTPPSGAATPAPVDWQTSSEPALGYSHLYPPQWELCTTTEHSRLFCPRQEGPRGPGFPTFYVSVIPAGFVNADASVYNFIAEDKLRELQAIPVGQALAVDANTEFSTYTRLADMPVAGATGVVIENQRVWEGGPETKDRRVLVRHGDATYMFGTYYEKPEELEVFHVILASVQFLQ